MPGVVEVAGQAVVFSFAVWEGLVSRAGEASLQLGQGDVLRKREGIGAEFCGRCIEYEFVDEILAKKGGSEGAAGFNKKAAEWGKRRSVGGREADDLGSTGAELGLPIFGRILGAEEQQIPPDSRDQF